MKSTDSDLPFAPPSSSGQPSSIDRNHAQAARDGARLAGFFLVATSAMEALLWAVQRPWGLTPHWIAAVEAVVQAGIGLCLLYFGQRAVSAALAFVLLLFVHPLARAVLVLGDGLPALQLGLPAVAALMGGRLLSGVVRAFPVLLLLAAAPSPRRRKVAAIAFIVFLLLYVSGHGLTMYSLQYTSSTR